MRKDLNKIEIYSEEITELLNDIEEVDNTKDFILDNFKTMFLELSTNN
jgi:t-SNARE complex subunit (syntaxin)